MLRRLLCSTLFPSRRSSDLFLLSLLGASLVAVGVTGELAMDFRSGEIQTGLRTKNRRPVCISPDLKSMARDRKSTRLNSSHQIISYAVFCLKKKTIDSYT